MFAPRAGGEFVTKPFIFAGQHLSLNFSTSAAGSIRIELQNAAGQPIEGYTLADCSEIFGDATEYVVRWKPGFDVGALAGQPLRLRCGLREADLYALQFKPKQARP